MKYTITGDIARKAICKAVESSANRRGGIHRPTNTHKGTERDAAPFANGHSKSKRMDGKEAHHAPVESHHGFGSLNRYRRACGNGDWT